LRSAMEHYAPNEQLTLQEEETKRINETPHAFGRQEIHTTFERSPLALILLFVGGLILEIGGIILWTTTQSAQTGLPLIVAGFVAVITAILVRRQK
jgi:hypothetical protein